MPGAVEAKNVVLVLAPKGRDAHQAANALLRAKIATEICATITELGQRLSEETDALLVAEEALTAPEYLVLLEQLGRQPPWSDIPVIILTTQSGEGSRVEVLEIFGPAANVTLLERPLRQPTLVAAINTALRARRRQREVRDLIRQRETVLASISDAFSALDREWRYTYVNDKVAELAGRSKEEIVGNVIWEIFPEAVGTEFHERCLRARERNEAQHLQMFYEPWGRWLDTRIYPTREGVVIFRADITETKQQEDLLRQSRQRLQELETRSRLAVEAADVGTFDFYPLTGELRWSNRCNELFGLPHDSKVDHDVYLSAIHPDDRHVIFETVAGVLRPESGQRYDIEYRTVGVTDGAERWISEKGRALLDETGRATRFIGTIIDITASKNAAMELERAKKQAEEANRTKDQFLAMLSHELRTPLTPVLMMIAALRRDPQISDALRRDLEVLQRNVELEALLIDDLLDLTRIAHGKFELHHDAVDIHGALEHALGIVAPDSSAKTLRIERKFEATEHHCWADPARIQQVFWNLLKNAVKFTAPNGFIELRTYNDDRHGINIEVADNGIGIEPELQPRIFDAFEQGNRSITTQYGGLGLGLAISKRVIDLHHGTIEVHSAGRGQGAMFRVRLNAMETSLLDGPAYLLQVDAGPEGPAKILLVEDHADTAGVMRRVLQTAGYVVEHAGTVGAALDLAANNSFDLVVSDVGLPDGTGLDLMRQLYHTQGLRGVALSGYGTDEDLAASKAAGFAEHLTKPVDWERLRDAIARIIQAKRDGSEKEA